MCLKMPKCKLGYNSPTEPIVLLDYLQFQYDLCAQTFPLIFSSLEKVLIVILLF